MNPLGWMQGPEGLTLPAVYVAAFVGLGAAVGRPILRLIQAAETQLLVLVLVFAAGLTR